MQIHDKNTTKSDHSQEKSNSYRENFELLNDYELQEQRPYSLYNQNEESMKLSLDELDIHKRKQSMRIDEEEEQCHNGPEDYMTESVSMKSQKI